METNAFRPRHYLVTAILRLPNGESGDQDHLFLQMVIRIIQSVPMGDFEFALIRKNINHPEKLMVVFGVAQPLTDMLVLQP